MEGEEEDHSNPNQLSTAAPPPAAFHHPKHAAMLERLSNRKQTTLSLKSNSHSSADPTQSFLSLFSQSKLSIESDLRSESLTKFDLDRISTTIADLEKTLAESSYFLPSYEVRSSLETISSLKQTLEKVSSDVVPKKKFAFKSKKASTGISNQIESEIPAIEPEKHRFTVRDSPGFRERENEVLVREFKGLEMGEFSLSGLSCCEVRLTGCLRALFVNKLRNCKVYVGAVFGSVLIEEVEGCVFVLASHQIRVHHAKGCDFYLRVRSRPIIEDCSGVRFAPYCLVYEGIEGDLKESNLDEETGNWANVDDFRWLKAVQSPNWSVLPESERVGRVTITNSDK